MAFGLIIQVCPAQQVEQAKTKAEEPLIKNGTLAIGDIPLTTVFQRLAVEAGIKLQVSDSVVQDIREKRPGINFDNITPLDAIRVISTSLNLDFRKVADVYYLRTYREIHEIEEVIGPMRAARIAAYRRNLYEAFLRKGSRTSRRCG